MDLPVRLLQVDLTAASCMRYFAAVMHRYCSVPCLTVALLGSSLVGVTMKTEAP